MKLLDDYFTLKEKIHRYFGYEENYHIYPIDDCTDMVWHINRPTLEVLYAPSKGDFAKGTHFTGKLIGIKLYVTKDYTALLVDTRLDGNQVFMVFDNNLQLTQSPLKG